jgi:alpha-L-rhamnosidase
MRKLKPERIEMKFIKMKRKLTDILTWGIFILAMISCQKKDPLSVVSLTVENREVATGVDTEDFFFSWKLQSTEKNTKQGAYHLMVSEEEDFSDREIVWNSEKKESNQSILVAYEGQKLQSGRTYFWRVKVWDHHGNESPWSAPGRFTTGLFTADDWNGAVWIAYDTLDDAKRLVPGVHLPGKEYRGMDLGFHKLPLLRKEFRVKNALKQALVFVSGLGHYEMFLNGKKTGDRFLAPGWTHYDEVVLYNTYDVTECLVSGENVLGVSLGNGFYIVPNSRYRKTMTAYGNPKMIARIQLEYKDGSTEVIVSDTTWSVAPGPVTYSSIFGGETYNALLEQPGWNEPGFDDSEWQRARVVKSPGKRLLPEKDYPVKRKEVLPSQSVKKIQDMDHAWLYDFGQNASGVVEIVVKGNRGDSVQLIPAELIDGQGHANQQATGRPHYYTYVLKGEGIETWSPCFTYYGFRYVQVEGAVPEHTENQDDLPVIKDIRMLHIRNSSPQAGQFSTSFDLFNRIDTLILWAIKSNLQSVVTDCPHREKLGWLEQTHLMGGSIHFNFNVYSLYSRLVDDMIMAQLPNGLVPDIVPEYVAFEGGFRDSPEWGSAAVILPWLIGKWYGDQSVMERAWPMMVRYVHYLKTRSENHIVSHGLGDWYDLGPERPGFAQLTPEALTATAIYYYDVWLMSQMARAMDREEEANHYTHWAEEIKTAFNKEFFHPGTNSYSTGSQTSLSMPLVVGLVNEERQEAVVRTLVESIHLSDNALTAGDVGFHYLVRALADNGQGELLYKMNAREDVPGYGYQLKKGATALTESWQALEVVSNNHLMLGHLMEWFYCGLTGIRQTKNSVAYKEIIIDPQVVGKIRSAQATYESPYGTIASEWIDTEDQFELKVEIPVNSLAMIVLPAESVSEITESGRSVDKNPLFTVMEEKKGRIVLKTGSGNYRFSVIKKS